MSVEEVVEEVRCLLHRRPPGGGAEIGVLIVSIATVWSPVAKILRDIDMDKRRMQSNVFIFARII